MTEYPGKQQFAIFTTSPIEETEELANIIQDELADVFTDNPTKVAAPIPELNVPKWKLSSEDGNKVCNISEGRIDFIFSPEAGVGDLEEDMEELQEIVEPVLDTVFEHLSGVNRLGFISQTFFESEDAVDLIKEAFSPENVGELWEIRFRFNEKQEFNEVGLNDITKIESTEFTAGEEQFYGISLKRDINIRPEEFNGAVDLDFASEFLSFSKEEIGEDELRRLV